VIAGRTALAERVRPQQQAEGRALQAPVSVRADEKT
jgi:hypothetical protein